MKIVKRFYKDRYYHFRGERLEYVACVPTMVPYEMICKGAAVDSRARKVDCIGEFHGVGCGLFRMEDGHMPEFQPVARGHELVRRMEQLGCVLAYPLYDDLERNASITLNEQESGLHSGYGV